MIEIKLQCILDQQHITQAQLAEMSGVRRARINEMCRDKVERLQISHVDAICQALNVPPWEWIVWTRDKE
ncbi:helix-turn-helix transcriptional regulator [Alicyclobacillus tolerans]|uniref:helix-turn-helix domain-containing protein n=1 Tax=Alicyclobacillus tolerans TaxID=90970 RepID=UPI001F3A46E1|nr:helix-turn-helix transcriptional regulator [Alicyclobacillus tolerans]MCF8565000.1 helix-turn-helix transcriptional regulator [Alicyclobacillus tolerans]